jgi:hypothetical protein
MKTEQMLSFGATIESSKDPRVALTTEGVTDYKGVDMTYLRPFLPSPVYNHKQNYLRYLDSREWQARKRAYWESNRPQYCWACGKAWSLDAKGFNFHHLTYINLYNETLEDLVLFCREHHEEVESEWIAGIPNKKLNREALTFAFICSYRIHRGLSLKPLMPFFKGLVD